MPLLVFLVGVSAAQQPQKALPAIPDADFSNLRYGPYERNVLDLWLAKSGRPTPLVLYFHGGGFIAGDKAFVPREHLNAYLDAGFSFAAIDYRYVTTAPAPAPFLDGARALQFLRANAGKWNLDAGRVAATGGSAGAAISMWLAFHDDLADPTSLDPIARESTRLTAIALDNAQPSYDPRFAAGVGIPRPNFERTRFFLPLFGITAAEIDTPKAYERYQQAAPITYLGGGDPPALLNYSVANGRVRPTTPVPDVIHHPKLGIALKQRMDALGIECVLHIGQPYAQPAEVVEFLRRHFEKK